MSEHKAKRAEGIVTSDAVQGNRRFSLPKKVLWPVVAVVVLAVLGGGGLAYKVYVYDPAHKKTMVAKPNRNSNDYLLHPDKQLSAAQAELNDAKTPQEKAAAYDHLAQAYLNGQKPSSAVDAANSSLSADSSTTNKLQALNILGYAYARDGQKDKAIAAFQQMVDIIKASNDDSLKQELPRVQSAIDEINQGQTL
jgi:cytochrome c-type biogenesis protein CcmH/NrfG